MRKFAKYKHGINIVPIYGGQHIDRQILALKKGASIVIGTPGRIMDHMRRRTLKLDNLTMIVLDEADEMLNMGFREDIETILKDVPLERQTILFSATMPPEILHITDQYQKNPQIVKMINTELTVPKIRQFYYEVPGGKKIEALSRLLDYYNPQRSMIFCNTKRMVDELTDELHFRGYSPDGLHGDMKQQSRDVVMNSFKKGKVNILIATDVAARGIDVDDIDAVFNFDLPQDPEYYIHRIGRTGRAGKSGTSYTFVSGRRQISALKEIEVQINSTIEPQTIPFSDEINKMRNKKLLSNIIRSIEDGSYNKYEKLAAKLIEMGYNPSQIACAALCQLQENNSIDTSYDEVIKKQAMEKSKRRIKTLFGASSKPGDKSIKKPKAASNDFTSYVLNVGLNEKITAKNLMEAFTGSSGIPAKGVGKISIHNTHTIVDIANKFTEAAVTKIREYIVEGKNVSIKLKRTKKK